MDIGIDNRWWKISILLYADDIKSIAENGSDLQMLLNILHKSCSNKLLNINLEKINIAHFKNQETYQKFTRKGVPQPGFIRW